jgi:hypothetical protein
MDDREKIVADIQKAAEFGTRMVPLVLRIRKARDDKTGMSLTASEVNTLVEILNVMRKG